MTATSLYYAAQHAWPILQGLEHVDTDMFEARLHYFLHGKFDKSVTYKGYQITNAQQLLIMWEMGVERRIFNGWSVSPGGLVLDIGANYGVFGWLVRERFPRCTLVGYEPMVDLAKFCENLECYNSVLPSALSDRKGILPLLINSEHGQLSATLDGGKMFDYNSDVMIVESERLDDQGLKPEVIKIDVDGGELMLAAGGYQTLRSAKYVICECASRRRRIAMEEILGCRGTKLTCEDYLFTPS